MIGKEYLSHLSNMGYKYTESDILFIAKDEAGNLVWLEIGNQDSGLMHIIFHHKDDFANAFGINETEIANYLYNVITHGHLSSQKPSRHKGGFEYVYRYQNELYTFVAMGSNGYIVTAFPMHYAGGE